ncbi:MAG: hypothetical protein V7K55_18705 [Nostoc sp.]
MRREASRFPTWAVATVRSVTGVVLARRVQHQTLDDGALRTAF